MPQYILLALALLASPAAAQGEGGLAPGQMHRPEGRSVVGSLPDLRTSASAAGPIGTLVSGGTAEVSSAPLDWSGAARLSANQNDRDLLAIMKRARAHREMLQ